MSGPTIDGPTVSAAGASRVVEAAVRRAEELGVAVVVWVVDPGGHDVAMLRMDGAPLLSRQVARDKAWSSVAFGQPTTWWATIIDDDPGLAALGRGNRLMPDYGILIGARPFRALTVAHVDRLIQLGAALQ